MSIKITWWLELLHLEFGAAFQEITKNTVLLRNLKQKLNFGIQKTAHANFPKITSIKKVIERTSYLSLVDASVICESLFKDRKAELSLFGNTLRWKCIFYGNKSIDLHCNHVTGFCVM